MTLGRFEKLHGNQAVLRAIGIEAPADALRYAAQKPLSIGRKGFVHRCRCDAVDSGFVYLKVNLYRKTTDSFRRLLTGDPALRESHNLKRLNQRGVPCAEVLARGSLKTVTSGLLLSFLVIREIEGAGDLETTLRDGLLPPSPNRQQQLATLGGAVGRLHSVGFVHHDLHFRNILMNRQTDGTTAFTFIDSPKGYWPTQVGQRRSGQVHDLACLLKHVPADLSLRERALFLRNYRGGRAATAVDRRIVRDAVKRAAVLMERRKSKLKERSRAPSDRPSATVAATQLFCRKVADRYGSESSSGATTAL